MTLFITPIYVYFSFCLPEVDLEEGQSVLDSRIPTHFIES